MGTCALKREKRGRGKKEGRKDDDDEKEGWKEGGGVKGKKG